MLASVEAECVESEVARMYPGREWPGNAQGAAEADHVIRGRKTQDLLRVPCDRTERERASDVTPRTTVHLEGGRLQLDPLYRAVSDAVSGSGTVGGRPRLYGRWQVRENDALGWVIELRVYRIGRGRGRLTCWTR